MRPPFARGRLAAASLAAATAAAAGLTLSGPAQQALAATITQTGPFPVGNLLNYANSDLESTGFNWAADLNQADNDIASIGQDTVSLMHGHSLKIVAAGDVNGTIIYKLGNGQDNTSVAINLPKTGGDYRVGAYMKVPVSTSQHTVEFDLGCYNSTGQWLGWATGTPVSMNTTGNWQYAEDDFLAGTPTALPSDCAQVQGSPRVKVTGMNAGGIVRMDEVIFAPYRAAVAIGAHGPKQCDGPACPYSSGDWWTANQDIAPLPNKALQTDKEFTANLPSTGTDPFSATNCAGDEDQVNNHGLNLTKWPVCIIAYQTPVTSTDGVTSQAMDNFLASVPRQQEIILVWHQEPENDPFSGEPGCGTQTGAMAFVCETKLQATFVHNSQYDTPNVFIAQDSAVSWYLNNTSCSWIAPSSATGAGVDLYLVDHYEYDTVTGQNVNTETGNSGHDYTKWQHWLKCASAQNRPLGFGEYGLDNSPDSDPTAPHYPDFARGCKPDPNQNRANLPGALEADRTYLANLPTSGDPNLVNPAPFAVWDYWDSFWGGTPDCTKLDNTNATDKWRSIETQNGGGG